MKLMMLLRGFCVASTLALVSAVVPANAKPSVDRSIQFVDLTDDFERIWEESVGLGETERVTFFQARFQRILPGFYDPARMASLGISPEKYTARLQKKIAEYPQQRDGIARVSGEFRKLLTPAIASFEARFGTMRDYPPIYIVHSMGEFDGATRDLPEGTRLLFGADVLDRLHKNTPIQAFFHHELFHLYHARLVGPCEPLWCRLWSEGLAVYVASQLNPDASDAALLLDFPEPIRPMVEARREVAICAVRKVALSSTPADYVAFFTGSGSPPEGLPARTGYYVGYLIASDLCRTRSLKELAALSFKDLEPLIMASLARLGSCPA